MLLARPVQVHRKGQVGRWREVREHLLELKRVGAEVEILFAGHDPRHDLLDLRMKQRLAAGNRHDRRTTFIHRRETLLGREVRPQHFGRMLDLTAAATGEIATKERLEHQHERIPGIAPQPLHGHVLEHGHHLSNRHTHATRSLPLRPAAAACENRAKAISGK